MRPTIIIKELHEAYKNDNVLMAIKGTNHETVKCVLSSLGIISLSRIELVSILLLYSSDNGYLFYVSLSQCRG